MVTQYSIAKKLACQIVKNMKKGEYITIHDIQKLASDHNIVLAPTVCGIVLSDMALWEHCISRAVIIRHTRYYVKKFESCQEAKLNQPPSVLIEQHFTNKRDAQNYIKK